jgi:endonuclease-3
MTNNSNKIEAVIHYFKRKYPNPKSELIYKNPYQLTVAVILSAQCTDNRVNLITPAFFNRFPSFKALAKAKIDDIYDKIKSCSYPNNKSKYLKSISEVLINQYDAVLPKTIEDLEKLPGIGRKSASVLALLIHKTPAFPVDTHVFRVANRLGITKNAKTPLASEKQLMKAFPEKYLYFAHNWLVLHGRYTCKARKPECNKCGLSNFCDYYNSL